jgi:alpha-glucoside transport system substrate-binding protein
MTGLPDATSTGASDAWNVSADLLGMFNDTPAARQLVAYLAGVDAQQIWPKIPAGGATSANMNVTNLKPSVYPDKVDAAIAQIMTNPHATLCFNASDLMPPTMQNAFYQGVMEYLQDPSPAQLTAILQRLEHVRQAVYQPHIAFQSLPTFTCGRPATG